MFSRTFITSLGASLLAVCASASIAADQQGWYLGAGVGSAKTISDSGKDSATGYKLYGGYQLNDKDAMEFEYADLGKYSDASGGGGGIH